MQKNQVNFWVTNFSSKNVSLADLNLTIRAFTSVNLLDIKHYQYTLAQLQKSAESGSIFNKRDKLTVREVAPEMIKSSISFIRETVIPSRNRSVYSIKEENYEELNVSDEEFAKENADIIDLDGKPLLKKV